MKKHAAPLIAAVLLLLPGLYAGSYLALVSPMTIRVNAGGIIESVNYRAGGSAAKVIYWPLEQIDRRLRPDAWGSRVLQPVGKASLIPAPTDGGLYTESTPGTDE